MSTIDLHLHSSVSDGAHSPTEIVCRAVEAGLSLIALTDHDTVDGIAEALAAAEMFPGFTVIPGVEISTETPEGEAHILGYFIDPTQPALLNALAAMRGSREIRAKKIINKLAGIGFPVEWERVRELAGNGTIGRPHIARALLEKGYISTIKDAFTRFLAWKGPAYVERDKMEPGEAISLIRHAGGLPVLAHPLTINHLDTLLAQLKEAGLAGLEAYYKDYNHTETRTLVSLAHRHDLLTTGGTDYHGLDESAEAPIGRTMVPPYVAEQLLACANTRAVQQPNHG